MEDIKSFKPNPGVYSHFLRQSGSSRQEAWLVTSNSFDVLGALSAGMKAVWLKPYPKAILDPWDIKPTLTITDLCDLPKSIS